MVKNLVDILETLTPERRAQMDERAERETLIADVIHEGAKQIADTLCKEEKLLTTGHRINIFRKAAHNMMTDVVYLIAKHDDNITRDHAKQLLTLYRDEVHEWFDMILGGSYDQVRDMIEQRQADEMKKKDLVQ